MQNNINSNKYILNIKFGELSEFGTPCQSLVTNSGAIPEESNHSGAIPADSGHSCGFRCHSGGFRCHSGGITGFRTESVGHCKVLSSPGGRPVDFTERRNSGVTCKWL